MKGDFVIVRAFGGEALVRRVWEVAGNTVFISAPEQYARLAEGQEALWPVGFPRRDVFHYDPALAGPITSGNIDWRELRPYRGGNEAREG